MSLNKYWRVHKQSRNFSYLTLSSSFSFRASSLAGLAGISRVARPVLVRAVRVLPKETKVTRLGWRPALALVVEPVPAPPQWHHLLQLRVRILKSIFGFNQENYCVMGWLH